MFMHPLKRQLKLALENGDFELSFMLLHDLEHLGLLPDEIDLGELELQYKEDGVPDIEGLQDALNDWGIFDE